MRGSGVELGRFARAEEQVLVPEDEPKGAVEDVGPVESFVGAQVGRLYEIIGAGDIETVTIGRLRKVPIAALDDYVEQRRAEART